MLINILYIDDQKTPLNFLKNYFDKSEFINIKTLLINSDLSTLFQLLDSEKFNIIIIDIIMPISGYKIAQAINSLYSNQKLVFLSSSLNFEVLTNIMDLELNNIYGIFQKDLNLEIFESKLKKIAQNKKLFHLEDGLNTFIENNYNLQKINNSNNKIVKKNNEKLEVYLFYIINRLEDILHQEIIDFKKNTQKSPKWWTEILIFFIVTQILQLLFLIYILNS